MTGLTVSTAAPPGKGHGAAHAVPLKELVLVLAALLALTVLTVAVTYVDLGSLNLVVALGIATLKALLVALFFMHLRRDRPFHGIVFLASILFVMLFVGLVLIDTSAYQPDLIEGYAPAMQAAQPAAAAPAAHSATPATPAAAGQEQGR
jgi:cytochrome c oxidase subunit IV